MTISEKGPGEARTKMRNRREIFTMAIAATVGGVIGFLIAFTDQGDGDLFSGEWDKLVLNPVLSVFLAIAVIIGIIVLPLWSFTVTDDFVKERNYIGYTGGGMAVMGGVPAWAILSAGGLVPPPTAPAVWAIGFFATMASFAFAWIRSR